MAIFDNIKSELENKLETNLKNIFDFGDKIHKTDGISPIGLVGKGGKIQKPGFTPNESYLDRSKIEFGDDSWYGVILKNHLLKILKTTEDRFKRSIDIGEENLSMRDHYILFSDSATDYFKHGFQIMNNRGGTPYENNDPIYFGFDIIIDTPKSPLLNGSVENFIEQFQIISEISERMNVITDFKRQFLKLFKTTTTPYMSTLTNNQPKISIPDNDYPSAEVNTNIHEYGRKSYMSYYLKKISNLNNLIEANTPTTKKGLVKYRTDVLTLGFNEDVSMTLGTLATLYKLLYWSKPNAKYIIPDNLLRFNCRIIISEVRNFNRVRKALNSGELEIIKENVSRYVYDLSECQLYFNTTTHGNEIDMSSIKETGEGSYTVTMDYKYVTSKFERWVPDGAGFGKYVGYDNGAIWVIGNPGSRDSEFSSYVSFPSFFTVGENTLNQSGVKSPIILKKLNYDGSTVLKEDDEITKPKSQLEILKDNMKNSLGELGKDLTNSVIKEVKNRINVRVSLLNNTINKIKNNISSSLLGSGSSPFFNNGSKVVSPPNNIYAPYKSQNVGKLNLTSGLFFDVRESLRGFLGDTLGRMVSENSLKMRQ